MQISLLKHMVTRFTERERPERKPVSTTNARFMNLIPVLSIVARVMLPKTNRDYRCRHMYRVEPIVYACGP